MYLWRCWVAGENKTKKQGKDESIGLETYLWNKKSMVSITIYCQIYYLEVEIFFILDIVEWILNDLSFYWA